MVGVQQNNITIIPNIPKLWISGINCTMVTVIGIAFDSESSASRQKSHRYTRRLVLQSKVHQLPSLKLSPNKKAFQTKKLLRILALTSFVLKFGLHFVRNENFLYIDILHF